MTRLERPTAQSTPMFRDAMYRRSLPKTDQMIEIALHSLQAHRKKGVTFYAIKKFIISTWHLEHPIPKRYRLMKIILKNLFDTGQLVSVTGRGLIGHFRSVRAPNKNVTQTIAGASLRPRQQPKREKTIKVESVADRIRTIHVYSSPRSSTQSKGKKRSDAGRRRLLDEMQVEANASTSCW